MADSRGLGAARAFVRKCTTAAAIAGMQAVFSNAANAAELPRALAQAAVAYDRAQAGGDRTALASALADDYRLVNSSAEVETKEQLIADFTDPSFHLEPYVVEKPIQTVWSDGAVLAGEVHLTGTASGKAFHVHNMFVDVWRLREGRWQVVFTQVTRFLS